MLRSLRPCQCDVCKRLVNYVMTRKMNFNLLSAQRGRPKYQFRRGGRAWSNAPVLKTDEGQPSVGSNPTLSAKIRKAPFWGFFNK